MIQKRRNQRKCWICMLALWIILSFSGCSKVEIPYVEVTTSEETFEDKFFYNLMDEEGKLCYREVYQGIINHDEAIYIHGMDWDLCCLVIEYILYDFPEIFWIDGGAESHTYLDECTVLNMNYIYTEEERATREAEIEAQVTSIFAQIPAEYSEYEKVKFVYEYLVDSIDYVEDAPDNQNIYSALVNKRTVCAGYARATQYLLNEMDIFCTYVTGTTPQTEEEGDGHAWNIAQIGENYYIIDTTWADALESVNVDTTDENTQDEAIGDEPVRYDYLCCSQESIQDTHFAKEGYPYPECNSNDLEYYRLNGRYFESLDEKRMEQAMKEDIAEGAKYTEFKFANAELYNTAIERVKGAWLQEVANYYCDLYGVDEMQYYRIVDEDWNKIAFYWVYE